MVKKAIMTLGDFTEDPVRPGTDGRYQAVYEDRSEAGARAKLATDQAALASSNLRCFRAHWTPPASRFGKGRPVTIFDTVGRD